MSVLFRHRAIMTNDPRVQLGGSGSGHWEPPEREAVQKVRPKIRYSYDPGAELMPAAAFLGHDPDFAATLEDYDDGPFDPTRRSILGRLKGMFAMDYQGARSEERRFLRRLLASRNAREAYVANRALHLIKVPHAIRRTLALGVAQSMQQTGPIEGYLSAIQARSAGVLFNVLGPQTRTRIWKALVQAGHTPSGAIPKHCDPIIERALILKALVARRQRLGPWSTSGWEAVQEVETFAETLRLANIQELGLLLSQPPDSSSEPLSQWALRAAKAKIDPIFALHKRHKDIIKESGDGGHDAVPISMLSPNPLLDRTRIHWALAEFKVLEQRIDRIDPQLKPAIDSWVVRDVEDYLGGKSDKKPPKLDVMLQLWEKEGFDICGVGSLDAIAADAKGIYKYQAAAALGLLLGPFTGATYVRKGFSDEMTAGLHPTDRMRLAVESGFRVPILIRSRGKTKNQHSVWIAYETFIERAIVERATTQETPEPVPHLHLLEPLAGHEHSLPALELEQLKLDTQIFNDQSRADAYYAPAILDLIAPPFGIEMNHFGIEDHF